MRVTRPSALVALLVVVVGVGGFFGGYALGQQQAQPSAVTTEQERGLNVDITGLRTRFGDIIRGAKEQVYEDERQRSQMTDDEARVALDWAATWMEREILTAADEATARDMAQRTWVRVRAVMDAIYSLKQSGGAEGK